jgi:hypothetical protein
MLCENLRIHDRILAYECMYACAKILRNPHRLLGEKKMVEILNIHKHKSHRTSHRNTPYPRQNLGVGVGIPPSLLFRALLLACHVLLKNGGYRPFDTGSQAIPAEKTCMACIGTPSWARTDYYYYGSNLAEGIFWSIHPPLSCFVCCFLSQKLVCDVVLCKLSVGRLFREKKNKETGDFQSSNK